MERASNRGLPKVDKVGTGCRDDRDFVQSRFRIIERESWTTVTDTTVDAQTAAATTGSDAEGSG